MDRLCAIPFISVRKEHIFIFEELMESRDSRAGLRENLPHAASI